MPLRPDLANKNCSTDKFETPQVVNDVETLQGVLLASSLFSWQPSTEHGTLAIERAYEFPDFLFCILFLTLAGRIAWWQDHHPHFSYRKRQLRYAFTTYSARGVTENDLIMAAKSDRVYQRLQRTVFWQRAEKHRRPIEPDLQTSNFDEEITAVPQSLRLPEDTSF